MTWRSEYGRGITSLACFVALTGLVAISSGALGADPPAGAQSKTIGLALTGFRNAFVETPEYEECGGKLDPGPVAQLAATPEVIERIKQKGGTHETMGPNGETPQNSPLLFTDQLPVPEVVTKTGYGVNLDGTEDGRATARTCKHEKFVGPEGEKVDHQLARVLGCVQGYRTGGQTADFYNNEVQVFPVNRHLIEITGVDDETNDPAVGVNIYKGYDRLVRTGDGTWIPMLSQRIDTRYPQYNMTTTGKIVNGELITDPIKDALMPHSSQRKIGDRDMKDMTLRLKLTPNGAEGILAGYDNWRHLWNQHSKRVTAEINRMSTPTIYRRFMQYADGYPDPKTGQCTRISAAYKITAVRALIVHPTKGMQRIKVATN